MAETLVVIPCLNEEKHLERLVLQLLAASKELPLRLVVADGGSTDNTLAIAEALALKHDNLRVLHNPKRLQAAAVNLAVRAHGEEAEFLIRIDAHADYPADYCRALVEEARRTGAASVVVAMKTEGKEGFQRAVAAAQNSKLGNGGSAHRLAGGEGRWTDHGHHALMRLDAFRAVGGYDESFSHNEDAELDLRLVRAGFTIWLTDKTSLVYYPRSSPLALFRQYVKYGEGRVSTILKHGVWPKLRQLAPAAVLPACLLALLAPFSGLALLPLLFWISACLASGVLTGLRTGDMRLAAAGPAAMLMHLGWSIGFWRGLLRGYRRRA